MHALPTVYPNFSNALEITTHVVYPTSPELPGAEGRLICKPRGQVGCLKRGGYSLRVVLSDWPPEVYEGLQKFINARINYYMDDMTLARGVRMMRQPPAAIARVQLEAREKFPILRRYEDDWPARDMISTFLGNAAYPKAKR